MSKKKAMKKVKSKTSSVKQRNRLRNKGKVKTKKHPKKTLFMTQLNDSKKMEEKDEDNFTDQDIADMVEKDDVDFLRKSIKSGNYGFLSQIRFKDNRKKKIQKKKNSEDDSGTMETEYEMSELPQKSEFNTKMLLPVKTKQGIERRYTEVDDSQVNEIDETENEPMESVDSNDEDEEVMWLEKADEADEGISMDTNNPVSMAKMFAKREEAVQKFKFRIGLLASTLLENPELKINNLSRLLEIMGKRNPELEITVKKLATLSLLEVFKDLLPSYQIKHQETSFGKLKKVTKQLMGYESQLLKGYKEYLTKLEKLANLLRRKKGDTRIITKPERNLGILAVKCLCELLATHPYFNYADNIVHLLTIHLDNPDETVRKIVEACYKKIFHEDKRGFISLVIVRRINHLVKSRAHSVHCEALAVLLSLKIKVVNLDQEKEDEIRNKKLMNKKSRALSMSKKERKRKKELEKVENEMLEAKAEESKKNKEKHLTEITKMVFLIYFRILKRAPRSNLLSITLEGLAKFAHCINLEFYQDLMNVLDHLLDKESLNVREQLYCIKTVFIILTGQGEALNIDPLHFYSHLYRNMLLVHAGKTHDNTSILLSTLEAVLITRRKKVTTQRMLSFTKRLATVALQLLHNGSLGALCIIKSIVQLVKSTDLLLDVESTYGQGIYNPELDEPEFSNAGNTALWELTALQRHYHPTVRKMSVNVSHGAPTSGEGSLPSDLSNLSCMDLYDQYDPSTFAFKPSIPAPKKNVQIKQTPSYRNSEFLRILDQVLDNVDEKLGTISL